MEFQVEIKNFGKLNHAKIKCRDITVFAGTNSTGKSYASRALYSIFSALAIDPHERYYTKMITDSYKKLVILRKRFSQIYRISPRGTEIHREYRALLAGTEILLKEIKDTDNPEALIREIIIEKGNDLVSAIKKFSATSKKFHDGNDDAIQEDLSLVKDISEYISKMLKEIEESLSIKPRDIIDKAYADEIRDNLTLNFQVESLTELLGGDSKQGASIKIESSDFQGSFTIERNGEISNLTIKITGLDINKPPLYLESPIYWKIEKGLFNLRYSRDFQYRNTGENELLNVPEYFYDADDLLYSNKVKSKKEKDLKKLSSLIEKEIGGGIIWDDDQKKLVFVEKSSGSKNSSKEGISLQLVATGIVQLGMIGYFLQEEHIGEGTILFLDEPEAHLHPEWQNKMMQVLYALKDYGVQIILATHSPTILQRLELNVNKHKTEDEVWLNAFSKDGIFDATKDDFKAANRKIAKSMNEAPYKMFFEE